MRFCMLLLLTTLLAAFAFAQDKVDLAVGFPSTTLGYVSVSEEMVSYQSEFAGIFDGFGDQFEMPSVGQILRERLYLEMSDEDAEKLVSGIKRGAFGLLDIGLKGPKLQLVLEHKDLSALVAALKKNHKDNPDLVPVIEDYYGTDVFELFVPLSNSIGGRTGEPDPVASWLIDKQFYLAVLENKYLVLSTSNSAVKDGIDFLSYPEDAEDTLLSNRRYKEAVSEFKDADAMLFINVSSVISTLERVSGDKGSNPMLDMIGEAGTVGFMISLVQYEQFKSFAAAIDYDEKDNTFLLDAALEFHNAPAWFEALRVEPSDWVFDQFIPDDSLLALTSTVGNYDKLYKRFRDFFFDRAKNAGQDELVEEWEKLELKLTDDRNDVSEILKRFGKGAAFVVIPIENDDDVDVVGMFALKDAEEAEEYFYDKLMSTKIGDGLRDSGMESETSEIEVYDDIEIHFGLDNNGFAFVPDGKQGMFLMGSVGGIKRIVDAKKDGNNLSNMKSWKQAKDLTWQKVSANMYLNVGSVIESLSGLVSRNRFMFGGGRAAPVRERDATKQDENPFPTIADIYRRTALVVATRSTETGVKLRISNAGLPTREKVRGMLEHFKKVALNKRIRDDLVETCKETRTYYSIKGKVPENATELVNAGRIDEKVAHDDYDTDGKREYLFAKQVKDPDIRQAILLAYQEKAGLRGRHLAVLWNGDVLALTGGQLEQALEAAEKGERVDDEDWYKKAVDPLIDTYEDETEWRKAQYEPEPQALIVIIDEEGNEEEIEVNEKEVVEETEEILDVLEEENAKNDKVK